MAKNTKINILLFLSISLLMGASKCSSPELDRTGIPPIDFKLEEERRSSALNFPTPEIHKILKNNKVIWERNDSLPVEINAGETLVLEGKGFGSGIHVDYPKVLFGQARALETELTMYRGHVDVKKAHYFEVDEIQDNWKADIIEWSPSRIVVKVPEIASHGPLIVSVQKRVSSNPSLNLDHRPHSVWDPNSERVHGPFAHKSDTVSMLSPAKLSNEVEVKISNLKFKKLYEEGEKIFWSYDYNIGSVHKARDLDWDKIMQGKAIDPIKNQKADPEKLFGAIPISSNISVPKIAREKISFDPYPIPNPLTSVIGGDQLYSGETEPTGYTGYIYASSLSPATGAKGKWIGFSCVSCHGQSISFPSENGKTITKVFPGLPNPKWSMKWTILTDFKGIKGEEDGIDGKVDKSMLLYHVPNGAGEHSLVRSSVDKHSPYKNDFLFSPIAIPNVTTHTPLRRSLSHTEFYAGFEGSYIHSEEPDGAIGSMLSESLKALTAYMTRLNKDDHLLHQLAIYRWLKENNLLNEVKNVSEKEFIYSKREDYPLLSSRLKRGESHYNKSCVSCHAQNFGTGSDENMMPINQVGTFFSPTIFQIETQSIRTAMMTHLYWVQKRGLLHDTHVKSLEDLVSPDRCNPSSTLYKNYYTVHKNSFKVPKGTPEQEKVTTKHAYFSKVSWDSKHLYWDYPKMLREFGIKEFGKRINIPAAPHPWCAENESDVKDMVAYLLTL